MTDPWMARQQAKEHHARLVRQAGRERRLELASDNAGERGFWARLFGLCRRVRDTGPTARPVARPASPRPSTARLDVAKQDT